MENSSKDDLDILFEWAVWGNLADIKEVELILLKGHLLIEMALETALHRKGATNCENYSFYRKILLLDENDFNEIFKKEMIVRVLTELNQMRNKLAHETLFDVHDGSLENWSTHLLENFEGTKFSKYTFRTKIAHSFSILAKNLLELQ